MKRGTFMLFTMLLMVAVSGMLASSLPAAVFAATVPVTTAVVLDFIVKGDIDWGAGSVMAVGSVAGGYAGVRIAVIPAAKDWTVRLLTLVILLELVHMAIKYALEIY